ncbi:MAG: FtsB family cell division protein [Janthinobacterium lividum]
MYFLRSGFLLDAVAGVLKTGSSSFVNRLHQAGSGVFGARRRIATCSAVVLAGMIGYHVVFGQNGLIAYRAKRDQVRDLRVQMTELQGENTRLHNHVDRLSGDPNAIEHEAREALHYTRPGEVIYTMPAEPSVK